MITQLKKIITQFESQPSGKEELMMAVKELIFPTTLTLKSVSDLMNSSLKVPNYQRGYKWTKLQVTKLLEDIDHFSPKDNEFYCLQPVVVKKVDDQWELIDGQQRVTTIWMILCYFKHSTTGELQYETRSGSGEFLNKLKSEFGQTLESKKGDNIDIYHFKKACITIETWFKEKDASNKEKQGWTEAWLEKLLNHSKVIWYAADPSDDSKEVFRRLNSGKIPLTNAELIKALFLINSSSTDHKELFEVKKSQIAREWDEIEYGLQNEDFWNFLNERSTNTYATRIEFIFDLLKKKKKDENDIYFTFHEYSKELDNPNITDRVERVLQLWQTVKQSYYRFRQWHEDDELYHRIGFLLFCRNPESLYTLYEKSNQLKKSEFRIEIDTRIKEKLKLAFKEEGANPQKICFDKFTYGETNDSIHNMLLWFNIHTHQTNKTRFPFLNYATTTQKGGWSLEHIHAQQSQELDSKKLIEYAESLVKNLRSQYNDTESEGFTETDKIVEEFKSEQSEEEKKKLIESLSKKLNALEKEYIGDDGGHSLDNMALLSCSHNSSVGNKIFSEKRQVIKEEEKKGSYIPIGTKRVFSKYYSKEVRDLFKWSKDDKAGYRAALEESIEQFRDLQTEQNK